MQKPDIQRRAAELHEGAEKLPPEVAQARQTAEYWKAEHLAGNARIGELHDELSATALRSADHLRKAIKLEATVKAMQARQAELVAVLARLCELNAAERPMAKVWNAAQALVDSHKGSDTRKPCTCDGAGRGPGRACVVKAGGRLGGLWRCADGCNGCDDCTDYEA